MTHSALNLLQHFSSKSSTAGQKFILYLYLSVTSPIMVSLIIINTFMSFAHIISQKNQHTLREIIYLFDILYICLSIIPSNIPEQML